MTILYSIKSKFDHNTHIYDVKYHTIQFLVSPFQHLSKTQLWFQERRHTALNVNRKRWQYILSTDMQTKYSEMIWTPLIYCVTKEPFCLLKVLNIYYLCQIRKQWVLSMNIMYYHLSVRLNTCIYIYIFKDSKQPQFVLYRVPTCFSQFRAMQCKNKYMSRPVFEATLILKWNKLLQVLYNYCIILIRGL